MTAPSRSRPLYDAKAPRRPVALSLNADLLFRIQALTPNLSATIESLLGDYLKAEVQRRDDGQQTLDGVIDAVNRLHDQRGFLSDEFSAL